MATRAEDVPSSEEFEALERRLFTSIDRRQRRRALGHRLALSAAVVAIAGASIAAGTVVTPRQEAGVAYCYAGSSTTSQRAEVALPDAKVHIVQGQRPSASHVADAVRQCGSVWRVGVFSTSTKSGTFPVPRLQACVRDDLALAVFPKLGSQATPSAFCSKLALTAP
jgi:hypothetical protein